MDVLVRTHFVYFSKKSSIRGGWKTKSQRTTKEQQTAQATRTTTRTERHAHRTEHFLAARNPASCTYFSAFRQMRLTHSAVVSKAYAKLARHMKKNYHGETARENWHKKEQTARRASIRRIRRECFGSSEERRPRDASPVSVVFGVDRGVGVAVHTTMYVATSTACCCCCARYGTREVRYVTAAVVVGYNNVMINWLTRVMVQHARAVAGATSYY